MVNWTVWLLWLSISLSIQEFHSWFFHISCSLSANSIIISSLLSSSQMLLINKSTHSISKYYLIVILLILLSFHLLFIFILFNHSHIIIISNCDSEWYYSHQIIIILIFYLNRFYIITSIQSISIHNFKHSSSDKQSIHILNSLLFPYSISLSLSNHLYFIHMLSYSLLSSILLSIFNQLSSFIE